MARHEAPIDPERLMLAVDAIFFAFEVLVTEGRPLRHPLELMASSDRPVSLADFSRREIDEASRFLERMGMLG
jgi:hypothetical protein